MGTGLRAIVAMGACGLLLACGKAGQAGGGSSGSQASHLLIIHVTGAGQVTSLAPAFNCASQCQQAFDAAATAHLTAAAAQGSSFKGWLGSCAGTGGCDLAMDSDRDVTAVFETDPGPPTPNDARISVAFTGNGGGRVTSTPAGIDCPGACSMTVQAGTSVSLSASAAGGSAFAGWGGACSGPGACNITAAGDITAWADFETSAPPPPPPPPPVPAECKEIAPNTPGTPVAVTTFTPSSCDAPMGDATGTAGLQSRGSPHGVTLHIVDGATGQQKAFTSNYDGMDGTFTPQPDGFSGVARAPNSDTFSVQYWNHNGNFVASGQTMQGKAAAISSPVLGGLLFAGDFMWSGLPARHQAWLVNDTGGLQWAHDLAAKGAVYGLGLDQLNRALVITDGGNGAAITAQWFDSLGTALTGEFVIIQTFVAGQNTWFESAPLIGGGVAVRRVDQANDADGRAYQTSQWLVTVGPGAASAQAAPQWLAARPNTRMQLARGGRAYAFLPLGAPGADCGQQVQVLAPSGVSCGWFDATVARGQCRTEDVALGLDGAVMQLLPKALSQANTCAYRWWPGALR